MTDNYLNEVTKRLLDIADVAYTAGCGLNTSNPWGAVTTYPPAWLQIYVKEGYQSIDPVLMFILEPSSGSKMFGELMSRKRDLGRRRDRSSQGIYRCLRHHEAPHWNGST